MTSERTTLRRTVTFAIGVALQLVMMGVFGEAQAAPETFNTALPVGKGVFVFREQFLAIKASDDPSPMDRKLEVLGGISVLGYGATSDLDRGFVKLLRARRRPPRRCAGSRAGGR